MATALTANRVYILDWSAANPAAYDLDDGTVGINYCYFPIMGLIRTSAEQKGQSFQFWGGDGYMLRYDSVRKIIQVNGKVSSRTELGYISKFFHTRVGAGSDPDYLVVVFSSTSDYLPAYDNDGDSMSGVFRGWFKKIPNEIWNPDENLLHTVSAEFHVVWS